MSHQNQSNRKSLTDMSSVKQVNAKETEQKVIRFRKRSPTEMELTHPNEDVEIGMFSKETLSSKSPKGKFKRCHLLKSDSLVDSLVAPGNTQPSEHSQVDMPRVTYSSLESPTKIEAMENHDDSTMEGNQLMGNPPNVCCKCGHERNGKNKVYRDNSRVENCLLNCSCLIQLCLRGARYYLKSLTIDGEERVKHHPLEEEDFALKEEYKVASYDEHDLKNHWNLIMIKQPFKRRLWSAFKNGILKRTLPMLSLYIVIYYTITICILTQLCDPNDTCIQPGSAKEWIIRRFASGISEVPGFDDHYFEIPTDMIRADDGASVNQTNFCNQMNTTLNTATLNATGCPTMNNTYFCNNYEKITKPWNDKEYRLTRVLTFLVGFYVSFVVRNWWQQVRIFPTTDKASLSMGSFLWVDSGIDESKIKVKMGKKIVTLMQFKKDIIRLFLLSWTMCFCRISRRLKEHLPGPKDFIRKGLMRENEFKLLKTKSPDGWLEKWATPLLWVNKMACNVDKNVEDLNPHVEDIKNRVKIKEAKEVGIALFKFKDDLQRLNNQYYFRIPNLMRHAIFIALYFYIIIGAFSGQGIIFHLSNNMSTVQKLIFNFPIYLCMKRLLLIGWLKTATDLQNPYGEDE